MPLYDYKCGECGTLKEFLVSYNDKSYKLCNCGGSMKRQFSNNAKIKLFPKGGIFISNVSAKGEHFSSEKQMRDYAKKHNVEFGALL